MIPGSHTLIKFDAATSKGKSISCIFIANINDPDIADKVKKIKYFGARKMSGEKRFAYIPTEDPEIVVPYYDTILGHNGGYYTF